MQTSLGRHHPCERALVVTESKQRLADLAFECGALQRVPAIAEGSLVGRHRRLVVSQCLGIRGDPRRLVAGLEQVFLGLLPRLRARVVIRQHTEEVFQPIGKELLDTLADAPM